MKCFKTLISISVDNTQYNVFCFALQTCSGKINSEFNN